MNFKEIEELLEKFYEGATTSAEERKLRDFFIKGKIPPHLSSHADLFRYYEVAGEEKITDPGFENRFLDSIGQSPSIPDYSRRKRYMYISGIAATLLLLAGLVITLRNDAFLRPAKNTTDREIAYQQAKKALTLISANFNTGLVQVQKLENFQEGLDKAKKLQVFQKGIDKMKEFSKFYQYQQIVINPGERPRP